MLAPMKAVVELADLKANRFIVAHPPDNTSEPTVDTTQLAGDLARLAVSGGEPSLRPPARFRAWLLGLVLPCICVAPLKAQQDSSSSASETTAWSFHVQATVIPQGHGDFYSPYASDHSLSPADEVKASFTATFFVGHKLWEGGELYVNPEILAGQGLSATQGVAGFPNGEIYRVDNPRPKVDLSRLFIRQTWGLGGGRTSVAGGENQVIDMRDASRLTLTLGKFSLVDFFDDNAYSHDARTQFMNWALMDNGAWDFAADTRGYTYGLVVEVYRRQWAWKFASVLMPKRANGIAMDTRFGKSRADNLEVGRRFAPGGHPGALRVMGYLNHAHMGSYRETIDTPAFQMDIARSRAFRLKYGFGVNAEQEMKKDLGVFFRYGWNDGHTETFVFTEIDRTGSGGIDLKGLRWKRPADHLGLAMLVNGISKDHADYLRAGGKGFIIGDGKLNYGRERIIEGYYSFALGKGFSLSPDVQRITNPAYNRDRGPVTVLGARVHWEF
jgi:high affinity Mn2+ porin